MTDATPSPLQADILARMLLVQAAASHLPDENSIVAFLCRGLEMLPGVSHVRRLPVSGTHVSPSPDSERYRLQFNDNQYGDIDVKLTNETDFAPYSPHVQNLISVIAVILEERRQRKLTEDIQTELEGRVTARTYQLYGEIQERRIAESAALAEKRRAERYLEIAEALIVELDESGCIKLINQRGCDLLGYRADELLGHNWYETVISEQERSAQRHLHEQIVAGKLPLSERHDGKVVTRTGETRHVAWHNALRLDGQRVLGTLSSGIDITARKRSEQALACEKELLSTTLSSIRDGVFSTDNSGSIVAMNPVAEQLTGWRETDALGRPFSEICTLFDSRTQARITCPVTQVLTSGAPIELAFQVEQVDRTGTKRAVSTTAAPIRDSSNSSVGVVVVIRDITERIRFQEQTQRAERLDAIGVLAGGIAHDFNNLLGGIFGYIALARELSQANEAQVQALDDALEVFQRARELTRQLLTFSKEGTPIRSKVDLRKLLTDCSRFVLSGSSVSCNLRFAPDLPEIAVDASQLSRVIDNLIRNAMQAMPTGGSLTVDTDFVHVSKTAPRGPAPGSYVRISITDTGTGIPPEILPKIFDPFFTTKDQGTGLGLSTAYSVVKKHDGFLSVDSQVGQGTTFNVYLPPATATTPEPVPVSTSTGIHRGEGRALVLDDEPYLVKLFERYLVRMGYKVTTVSDGKDAILAMDRALVENEPYAVTLMDLTIPGGMGGKESIRYIRPKCPTLVAIAVSGYSEDPVMVHPEEYGFTASLSKPFSLAELANILSTHLPSVNTNELTEQTSRS